MANVHRLPPGPPKKFERYFTTPVTKETLVALEKLKWRVGLDKTEIIRRFLEYILTLPPDAQDKLLRSFDETRKQAAEALKQKAKQKLLTRKTVKEFVNITPPPIIRVVKRSGLP